MPASHVRMAGWIPGFQSAFLLMCLKLQHPHGPIRTKFLAPDIGMVQLWLLQAFDISAPSHFAFQINLKSELHALLILLTILSWCLLYTMCLTHQVQGYQKKVMNWRLKPKILAIHCIFWGFLCGPKAFHLLTVIVYNPYLNFRYFIFYTT